MPNVTILIPTKDRNVALAATLTAFLSQSYRDFSIIVSDQSTRQDIKNVPTFKTLQRIFTSHGNTLSFFKNLPRLGMAQQRQFLLEKSLSPYSLFLDDDCILEPYVIKNLLNTIQQKNCGFVGQAIVGLSFKNDFRPYEEHIEFWDDEIIPETIWPHGKKWQRYKLHNAANVLHVQEKLHLSPDNPRPYKIAWVGGCVLYDTKKLRDVGGFSFWENLPKKHAGEDVLAQIHVMKKYGGCAILPTGAYHQELPTTIKERKINAPEYLKETI